MNSCSDSVELLDSPRFHHTQRRAVYGNMGHRANCGALSVSGLTPSYRALCGTYQ